VHRDPAAVAQAQQELSERLQTIHANNARRTLPAEYQDVGSRLSLPSARAGPLGALRYGLPARTHCIIKACRRRRGWFTS
jgi:hypothetical protein